MVTAPASVVVLDKYKEVKVSGQVASQTSNYLYFYGTTVMPPVQIPSVKYKEAGSTREPTFAEARALCTILLMAVWQW